MKNNREKIKRNWLQRFLPFWAAILVDRSMVLLLPLIVISIPLVRLLPSLYKWRINSRIYRNYGELWMLEDEIERDPSPEKIQSYLDRFDNIERCVNRLSIPLAFNNPLYTLCQHIDYVRTHIAVLGVHEQQGGKNHA